MKGGQTDVFKYLRKQVFLEPKRICFPSSRGGHLQECGVSCPYKFPWRRSGGGGSKKGRIVAATPTVIAVEHLAKHVYASKRDEYGGEGSPLETSKGKRAISGEEVAFAGCELVQEIIPQWEVTNRQAALDSFAADEEVRDLRWKEIMLACGGTADRVGDYKRHERRVRIQCCELQVLIW